MKSHAEPVSLKSAQYLSFVSVIFTLTLCIAIAPLAYAATFTVMNTNDSGAGSLRQAIADASAGDTIDFDPAVAGTITLTGGQLTIGKNLTILGPGADRLTISGGGAVRIFTVNDGVRLDLQGLTVANGSAAGANGGGIMNSGTSIITACTFSSNTALRGGGIYSAGSGALTVSNSTFSGNNASYGGGIHNGGSATATITNSTFSANTASVQGGAFRQNSSGAVTIANCTFSGNSVGTGNGSAIHKTAASAAVNLLNTIVANSAGGGHCNVAIADLGYNIDSGNTCGFSASGSMNGTNPLLGPLANNGGPTQTFALLVGSPAIDAGNAASSCPGTDQRGLSRPQGAACDIGALEVPFATFVDDDWVGLPDGTAVTFPNPPTPAHIGIDAFETVKKGVDATAPGGTVRVAPGNYNESVTVVIGQPLTLLGPQADVDPRPGAGSSRTPGGTAEAVVSGGGTLASIFDIRADDIEINGFEVTNGTADLITSPDTTIQNRPAIRYNIVHGSSTDEAIELFTVVDAMVEFNHVYDTAGDGITFANDSLDLTGRTCGVIRFNEVHDISTTDSAIYVYSSPNVIVEGNLVYNVNRDGIRLGHKGGWDSGAAFVGGTIRNNIVHHVNLVYDAGKPNQGGITICASNTEVVGNEVFASHSENGAIFVRHGVDNVAITGNSVHDNGVGSDAWTTTGIQVGYKTNYPTNVVVKCNRIVRNELGLFFNYNTALPAPPVIDAEGNWWGCNYGPGATGVGCSGTTNGIGTNGSLTQVDVNPWLVLQANASPGTIPVGGTSTVTADLTHDSEGSLVGICHILDGTPISYIPVLGLLSPPTTLSTSNGVATTGFTAGTTAGEGGVSAAVDEQSIKAPIMIMPGVPSSITATAGTPQSAAVNTAFATNIQATVADAWVNPISGVMVTFAVPASGASGTFAGGVNTAVTDALGVATAPVFTANGTAGSYMVIANISPPLPMPAMFALTNLKGATTTTITSDLPDPSLVGQAVTVSYMVMVNPPGTGSPTGNVMVSDGVDSCVGTVAGGSCSLVFNTLGTRTLTGNYAGDSNYHGSISASEPHQVNNPPTYTISGHVLTSGGAGISGTVMNGLPGNPSTDALGFYSAIVDHGWSGTATPLKAGYAFIPASRNYSGVTATQPGQDYTAMLLTYTISGHVHTPRGAGLPGVVMNGLPGNPATDASGFYSAIVDYGWSGTAAPLKADYSFSPAARTYSSVASDQPGQDYTGTAPVHYNLSIIVEPYGSGVVEGTGIHCPADCEESYQAGTGVILTAEPAPGYVFERWEGCASRTSQCDLPMNSDMAVTARFRLSHLLKVTIIPPSGGRVMGEGIDCPADCREDYRDPASVFLTAIPNEGFVFALWVRCHSSSTNLCVMDVDSEASVLALFALETGASILYSEQRDLFTRSWMLYIPILEVAGEDERVETHWLLLQYNTRGNYFTVVEHGERPGAPEARQRAYLRLEDGRWLLHIPACEVEFDPDHLYWLTLEVVFVDAQARINVLEYGMVQ